MWNFYTASGTRIADTAPSAAPLQINWTAGTTQTVSSIATNVLVLWTGSTTTAKTLTIPTSTGFGNTITVMDFVGNAGTGNITASPVSGSITGNAVVYVNNMSITLQDSVAGWVSV